MLAALGSGNSFPLDVCIHGRQSSSAALKLRKRRRRISVSRRISQPNVLRRRQLPLQFWGLSLGSGYLPKPARLPFFSTVEFEIHASF